MILMKNINNIFQILVFLLVLAGGGGRMLAQGPMNRAETLYKQGAFADAAKIYERYLAKNRSMEGSLGLARCYRAMGLKEKAEQRYAEVVFNPASPPENKLEFGKMLKGMGKYEKAKTWFLKYVEQSGDSLIGTRWVNSCDWAKNAMGDSMAYQVSHSSPANSKNSEISPVWYKNGLLFSSNRSRGFLFRFVNAKTKMPFYDLYFSEFSADGQLGKPSYQRDNLNTKFHDGPIGMPAAENVAFITRNNTDGLGTNRDVAGFSRVNIYRIENHIGRWRKGTPVPFSSAEYNIAHPTVSADGTTLYFVSDMPGGFGGTDIYRSRLLSAGWTTPENLGPKINTESNEGYPYLSSDSTLFFASDRPEGFGGKDIFSSQLRKGTWSEPQNAGYPLNTPSDDFGVCISPIRPVGFFSTNRASGKGDDDIWAFKRFKSVQAIFIDALTGLPLEGVRVEISDINQKTSTFITGLDGKVKYTLRVGQEIFMKAGKEEFQDIKETVSVRSVAPDQDLLKTFALQGEKRYIVAGTLVDAGTRKPIEGVTVRVIGGIEERRYTNERGQYQVPIQQGEEYTVIFQHANFIPTVFNFNTLKDTEARTFQFDGAMKKGAYLWVEGQAFDPERQHPVGGANIHILNSNTRKEVRSLVTRSDGLFWQVLDEARDYTIVAARGDYFTARAELKRDSLVSDTNNLKLEMLPLQPGRVFKTLYYDYNSSNISDNGKRDLEELAFLLKENPGISIELSSHTDSRGGADFNKRLSQTRADQTVDYLSALGIDRQRIKAIGHGEELLANNCIDGVSCTDELHAQNRRTELKIIRIDKEKQSLKPIEKEELKGNVIPEGKGLLKVVEPGPKSSDKPSVDPNGGRTSEPVPTATPPLQDGGRIPGAKLF